MLLNRTELAGKLAYFRAVDTSAIPPQAGSNAVSNKFLLSFVNFAESPVTMHVRVALPKAGSYAAERFGPGDTYAQVYSILTLNASPTVELTETLGVGDAVQYILTPPSP